MKVKPTSAIRDALNELCRRNERTHDAETGEMYLGPDVLVVQLRRPKIIEGQWTTVTTTVDLFDLIDHYQQEAK